MNEVYRQALDKRRADYPIADFLLGRWSPRAMTGEAISHDQLMSLLEAARWAPSSYNDQPWRFVYALRDSEHWDRLFELLSDWNKQWCKNAGALMVMTARKNFLKTGKPNVNAEFDTGSSWMALALQGASMGLVVHGMAGFDYDRAASDLKVPDDHVVLAMCAIGVLADPSTLPNEYKQIEVPSERNKIDQFAQEGIFGG